MPRTARALLGALLLLVLLPAAGHAQASRTWVSGNGDDTFPCSRTSPCKTFAGAYSNTADGGEIDALDASGYGTLTIMKGLTIAGTGTNASALNTAVNGFVINAPGKDVTLRDLTIAGAGTTCGVRGIRVLDARSVRIEGVDIQQQGTAGIEIAPQTGPTTVTIRDTDVSRPCGATPAQGVVVAPLNGSTASVMLSNVSLAGWSTGLTVGAGGQAYLADSTVFGNGTAW